MTGSRCCEALKSACVQAEFIPNGVRLRTFSINYAVASRFSWRMERSLILWPGDVSGLPSGYDAWVVNDEPLVLIRWFGANNCAKT